MDKKIYQTPYVEMVMSTTEHLLNGESNVEQDHDADARDNFFDDEDEAGYMNRNLWDE